MIADSHMHTSFSTDSSADVRRMIARAAELGMTDICITDHFDKDYPNPEEFQLDTAAYFAALIKLRDIYAGKIRVRIGVEVGLQRHLGPWLADYLAAWPFDFVIGSMHLLGGHDPYYKEDFAGIPDEKMLHRYFTETARMLDIFHGFDALGHLDYMARYLGEDGFAYNYADYSEEIDAVLTRLIDYDVALELNTAGYRYALRRPNPGAEVIRRYLALGGKAITLGSDAHAQKDIGAHFPEALLLLKESGCAAVTVYEKRRPVLVEFGSEL